MKVHTLLDNSILSVHSKKQTNRPKKPGRQVYKVHILFLFEKLEITIMVHSCNGIQGRIKNYGEMYRPDN